MAPAVFVFDNVSSFSGAETFLQNSEHDHLDPVVRDWGTKEKAVSAI
jgi:hypothetical protein